MLKKFSLLILIFFLVSCTRTIGASTTPLERIPLNLPNPKPLELSDINFIIMTKENSEKVFQSLEDKKLHAVGFCLSGDGYKSLSINIQQIKEYLILQKDIIEKYRNYYEED